MARKLRRGRRRFSVLRLVALLLLYGSSSAVGALYFAVTEIDRDLPRDLTVALDYWPKRASLVYSADGELIGEFYLQKRIIVDLDRVPLHVQQAFISAEDQRFLDHPGFDLTGMFRAAWANWRHGGTQQGASTITQQVTRMLLLTNERSYRRKMRELVLAVRVERELTKREILGIYLNHVYLGHGAYGVAAAADVYFGKHVDHLTVSEGAMLAGLVKGPSIYSPHISMARARERQDYVLTRMRADTYISEAQLHAALREPLTLIDNEQPLNHVAAPYFVEHIRRWATKTFGEERVLQGGLRIYTTLDTGMQRSAEAAVRGGLQRLDKRIGFRGPLGHVEGAEAELLRNGPAHPHMRGLDATSGDSLQPGIAYVAVVTGLDRSGIRVDLGPRDATLSAESSKRILRWRSEAMAPLRVGDLIPVTVSATSKAKRTRASRLVATLAQTPDVQGAMIVMEPHTGRVRAMVGGYDFVRSQFNRATQAHRQIGSAMKPFIYAAAMKNGLTQLDIVNDAPVAVRTSGGVWRPRNYDGSYKGPVTLRTALAKSLNTVSVRLVLRTGLSPIITLMRDLGIRSPIPRHASIALGTPDLSLLEVTSAYAAFPNGGRRVVPIMVDKVVSGRGEVLLDNTLPTLPTLPTSSPVAKVNISAADSSARKSANGVQAISPELAFLVVDLMQGVVERGTGRRALVLQRPAAGKTGTSTEHRDAWFIGYTHDLVAGVWVGRDDFTPIGAKATGGSTALPIWLQFMQAAHPQTAPLPFEPPAGIVFVRANELTGQPSNAAAGHRGVRLVPFMRGTVPKRFLDAVQPGPFARATATPQRTTSKKIGPTTMGPTIMGPITGKCEPPCANGSHKRGKSRATLVPPQSPSEPSPTRVTGR